MEEQVKTGKQCADCKPGPTDLADWRRFQESMMRVHGIAVDDLYCPDFITAAD